VDLSMNQKILTKKTNRLKTFYLNSSIQGKNGLNKSNIYHGNLILVNKDNPLNTKVIHKYNHFVPGVLNHKDIYLEIETYFKLNQLIKYINSGDSIIPISGYRSMQEQKQIFTDSIKENGMDFTQKYVALPGHSEHQTGLAIDLAEQNDVIDFICPNFPYDGICGEFRFHAGRFGFIERYPAGKEELTGIGHEPWHFRYVSYPHSEIIQNFGFTLEEYVHFLKNFSFKDDHLKYKTDKYEYEIFYVKESDLMSFSTILAEEKRPYQISGNNVDGIIITLLNQVVRKSGVKTYERYH
jgi:D-alanyl-D-alanine dipeptidase/carboxypeptidase